MHPRTTSLCTHADDIDFQAAVKRNVVTGVDPAACVATVTDEMNASGRQSVVRERLAVLVTTQMSLYNPKRWPRQDLQTTKHYRSRLDQTRTAQLFLKLF
jgi:hypothetical protein